MQMDHYLMSDGLESGQRSNASSHYEVLQNAIISYIRDGQPRRAGFRSFC